MPPVRKVVKRFGTTTKLFGLSFLVGVFLVKVSETSESGNLAKVSVVNIICLTALGTSFTTFNVLSSYGVISVLPWFSEKSTVTLSIQSCIRVVGLAATIIDVIPADSGDKGLLVLPMVFVYPATLLVLNCFVYLAKVKEEDSSADKPSLSSERDQQQNKDNKSSSVKSNVNEVAVFTVYTDEMSIQDEKL